MSLAKDLLSGLLLGIVFLFPVTLAEVLSFNPLVSVFFFFPSFPLCLYVCLVS